MHGKRTEVLGHSFSYRVAVFGMLKIDPINYVVCMLDSMELFHLVNFLKNSIITANDEIFQGIISCLTDDIPP